MRADWAVALAPLPELLRKVGYQTAGFGKTHWLAAGASTRGFEVRYASTDHETGAIMMSDDNPAGLKRYHDEVAPYGDGFEKSRAVPVTVIWRHSGYCPGASGSAGHCLQTSSRD